jgi:glycosyltransferase involved in cell wall biosynthesis
MNSWQQTRFRVAVVMSTWNGARYLDEQVRSILSQEDVDVHLIVRDDGSRDETKTLLTQWAKQDQRIRVYFGDNLGVVGSFFDVLTSAGDDYDYYAFADQDDIWLSTKLRAAIHKCRSAEADAEVPQMYYSRLTYTDERLNITGHSTIPAISGYRNALVQNQATGCTIVLNPAARKMVCNSLPEWALMHDWWCYLVVSAFGKVIYDSDSYILYRKHGNNVTPATPNFMMELYARTRRFFGENDIPEKVSDQARLFRNLYYDSLSEEHKKLLDGFLAVRKKNFPGRMLYALNMPVRRNTPFDNFIMRLLIIIGRF